MILEVQLPQPNHSFFWVQAIEFLPITAFCQKCNIKLSMSDPHAKEESTRDRLISRPRPSLTRLLSQWLDRWTDRSLKRSMRRTAGKKLPVWDLGSICDLICSIRKIQYFLVEFIIIKYFISKIVQLYLLGSISIFSNLIYELDLSIQKKTTHRVEIFNIQ